MPPSRCVCPSLLMLQLVRVQEEGDEADDALARLVFMEKRVCARRARTPLFPARQIPLPNPYSCS